MRSKRIYYSFEIAVFPGAYTNPRSLEYQEVCTLELRSFCPTADETGPVHGRDESE